MLSTPGETVQSSQKINVIEWLKDNKLSDVKQIFIDRNIEIEELLEFDTDELREFGMDIQLDTLYLNRFIKAVNKLKQPNKAPLEQQQQQSQFIQTNSNESNAIKMNYPISSQLVVTTEENEMMLELYNKYDQVLNRINEIEEKSIPQLHKNVKICKKEINHQIDQIEATLKRNQEILMQQIDDIKVQKIKKLQAQLKSMETYKAELTKKKTKFEDLLNADANKKLDVNERKKKVINIINTVLTEHKNKCKDKDILAFVTQPDIQIDFYNKKHTMEYLAEIQLNSFDDCHAPILSVKKIKSYLIKLQWSLAPIDLDKDLEWFILEYKPIGDVSTLKKHDEKKDDDNKDDSGGFFAKLKKGVSSLFDDTKDEKEEAKKMEWFEKKIKIKKKYLSENEWESRLDDLETNYLYYIRMYVIGKDDIKSEYCETLKVITKDVALKWNKAVRYKQSPPTFKKANHVMFDKSYASMAVTTKAFSMKQNGKKVSWEIQLHQISNPSWIGFVNISDVNNINVNVNCNVGTQGNHQCFGVYMNNTTMTVNNGKRNNNNKIVGATTMYSSKTVVAGDKFIFKVNFKKQSVEVYHNELNLGAIFTNIDEAIVPAVSNNTTMGEYTIRLL